MLLWTLFAVGVLGGLAYYLSRHPELLSGTGFSARLPSLPSLPSFFPSQNTSPVSGPRPSKVSLSEAVTRLATAIARFETGYRGVGFPLDPRQWKGRAAKNNNPGNLRFIGQAGSTGQDSSGYAIFRTPQDGWTALLADVRAKITGRTRTALGPNSALGEFIAVYAPASENPTAAYIAFVSAELGISAATRFVDWVAF